MSFKRTLSALLLAACAASAFATSVPSLASMRGTPSGAKKSVIKVSRKIREGKRSISKHAPKQRKESPTQTRGRGKGNAEPVPATNGTAA